MSHKKHFHSSINSITAEELREKMDLIPELIVINVLDKETYVDCHITGSINIPYDQLVESVAGWEKDKEIVLYCAHSSCPRSKEAYELLADLGFFHLYEYSNGIKDWLKKGFDTTGTCTLKYLHQ